jgi:hypothetical protein
MRILSLVFLAIFLHYYSVMQSNHSEIRSKPKLATAYVDQANDALEAVDRLFEIQGEARLVFIPARLEAEKYIAKAGRLAVTSEENTAHQALSEYYAELYICRIGTEASGRVSDSCKGGSLDPHRIKAFALINSRPLSVE